MPEVIGLTTRRVPMPTSRNRNREWDEMSDEAQFINIKNDLDKHDEAINGLRDELREMRRARDQQIDAMQQQLDRRFASVATDFKDFREEVKEQIKELATTVATGFKEIAGTNGRVLLALFAVIGSLAAGAILYALTLR